MDAVQEDEMGRITLTKVFAALPQGDTVKPMRLSGDPTGENLLYCNGSNVYIRNLIDPVQVDIFTGHVKPTTVARYSPSGLCIASADLSGKVLVWDAQSRGHEVKAEHQVLDSLIRDLDWSPDGLFLVVCGYGDSIYARVLDVEDGTPCGKIEGHYKLLNSCCCRPCRPFFIATAGEDNSVIFHEGPPYRVKAVHKVHNHYVMVVKYSKDGDMAVSGGADGKLFIYHGKSPDISESNEIGAPAHQGPIYDANFSPDGKELLTVSGDGTSKVFDVESGCLLWDIIVDCSQTMMLGCLWQGNLLVTVNTRGHMYYYALEDGNLEPDSVVKGHAKSIAAMVVSPGGTRLFTGNEEGIVCWDSETGVSEEVRRTGQPGDLLDMAMDRDHLVYVGGDCLMHFVPLTDRRQSRRESEFADQLGDEPPVRLPSQPVAVDANLGWAVVACLQHVTLAPVDGHHKLYSVEVASPATCVSVHPGATSAATGHKDGKIRVFWMHWGSLQERGTVLMHAAISAIAYAPCGAYLAVGAEQRVSALSATDYRELSKREAHTGRVCCLAWAPDSARFVTSGKNGRLVLWDDVNDSYSPKPGVLAHEGSHANRIAWLNNGTVVTAGEDGNIMHFTITPKKQAVSAPYTSMWIRAEDQDTL